MEISKQSEDRLVGQLLAMAENVFGNHGCNDLCADFWDTVRLSPEEKAQLLSEMQEWHGDKESPYPEKLEQIGDDLLMRFYADKLRGRSYP